MDIKCIKSRGRQFHSAAAIFFDIYSQPELMVTKYFSVRRYRSSRPGTSENPLNM